MAKTFTSAAFLIAAVAAIPNPNPSTAACTPGKIAQPTMWNLYPSQPDLSQSPFTYLEVQIFESYPQLQQVAVFSGIPPTAKSCTLGWSQSDSTSRTFVVEGSGLIAASPLTGFPAEGEPVSTNSIKPFETAVDDALTPDFTSWDQVAAAWNHTAGAVDCAEEIHLKLEIDARNGDGHVYFEQDAANGLYVSYTC
ncbi:uncharacterized protein BCR38DRAFT_448582 [Pseudomassariella vexata]|uniref:Ubiquitin 3 binding protein But2 C-terminal domain-containing protein n=1 Tax=Pseudomassariella vexata TaxID=1141098 RepID=A0A1Y2DEQ4_9PEZI|nr:uncharacterized protein BCR38DRAFT_448582 [Pseudomassariella vexata]ORY57751.1 hypothetical protein BCR38DRAFT_448582 [Pseudomassariella vexata]